jgi:hypothetical protein
MDGEGHVHEGSHGNKEHIIDSGEKVILVRKGKEHG